MFENIYVKEETTIWTGRSTVVLQVTKASLPLVLSLPINWIGTVNSGILLGVIGLVVSILLMVIYFLERKHSRKDVENVKALETM